MAAMLPKNAFAGDGEPSGLRVYIYIDRYIYIYIYVYTYMWAYMSLNTEGDVHIDVYTGVF